MLLLVLVSLVLLSFGIVVWCCCHLVFVVYLEGIKGSNERCFGGLGKEGEKCLEAVVTS